MKNRHRHFWFYTIKRFLNSLLAVGLILLAVNGLHEMVFSRLREDQWFFAEIYSTVMMLVFVGLVMWKKKFIVEPDELLTAMALALIASPAEISFATWAWNKSGWTIVWIVLAVCTYVIMLWKPLRWWKVWYRYFRYAYHAEQLQRQNSIRKQDKVHKISN